MDHPLGMCVLLVVSIGAVWAAAGEREDQGAENVGLRHQLADASTSGSPELA